MNDGVTSLVVLADNQWDVLKLLVIGGLIVGGILAYHAISSLGAASRVRQTEQTKREIAAYVAEGSITPETAEKLLTAGAPENWNEHVAQMVQSGTIDSDEAAKLLKAGRPAGAPAKA